jgi:hypothetical protein
MEADMETQTVTLVTIIAEAALQEPLCKLALKAGAGGYTVSPCTGSGSRGVRRGLTDVDMNVKVEILTRSAVAEVIAAEVAQRYAPHYALILFMQPVNALALQHPF